MKHKYTRHQFDFEDEPHYLHWYKRHWWSRWKLEMDGPHPAIYKINKSGNLVQVI